MDSLEPGAVIAARYRLIAPASGDLQGVDVWEATDQVLDRPVRIILVTGPDAPLTLDAARRAALVSNEHMTRVLDVLTSAGHSIVVTEPHIGSTLADLVEAQPLNAHAARAIIGAAATALEAAARRGVHHGALRPSAIRIHRGLVKVTGIGIDGDLVDVAGHPVGDALSRQDTVSLVGLLHYALTGVLPAVAYAASSLDPAVPQPPGLQSKGELLTPPRDLDPRIQRDLDTLCVVTLGPNSDGPANPAELVLELAPWNQEDVPITGEVPLSIQPPSPAVTGAVTRQSVRTLSATPSIGASRPGTPPPAGPVWRSPTGRIPRSDSSPPPAVDATAVGAGPTVPGTPGIVATSSQLGASPTPSLPRTATTAGPAADLTPMARSAAPQVATSSSTKTPGSSPSTPRPALKPATTQGGRRVRFNPTPYVLVLMVALVGVAAYMAFETMFTGYRPAVVQPNGRPGATSTDGATTNTDGSPNQPVNPVTDLPVIISGTEVTNPGEQDHPEQAPLAIDGDSTTSWNSLEYKTAEFGGLNRLLEYKMSFEKSALVSMVHLATASEGGNVEVRLPDGTVVASGPLSASTQLILETPVTTDGLTLHFNSLPTAADGKFKVQVFEITVT